MTSVFSIVPLVLYTKVLQHAQQITVKEQNEYANNNHHRFLSDLVTSLSLKTSKGNYAKISKLISMMYVVVTASITHCVLLVLGQLKLDWSVTRLLTNLN